MYEINSPTVKELKVKVQKDITTYLNYSLPLCGILSDERRYAWLYEHFVQLYALTDQQGNLWVDYLEDRDFYKDVAEYKIFKSDELRKVGCIIEFIIEKINMGYYLIIFMDEYYLPGKASYNSSHFVHQLMVYGYDNDKKVFKTIAFNNINEFTVFEYEYNQLEQAYEQGKAYYSSSPIWVSNETIEMVRINTINSYSFNLDPFIENLDIYLKGEGNYSKIRSNNLETNGREATFNFNIYNELLFHLSNLIDGKQTMDYRYMHLMFEHKAIMFKRFLYISSKFKVGDKFETYIDRYLTKVRKNSEVARNLFFKQMVIKGVNSEINESNSNKILSKVLGIVEQVKVDEQIILEDIYDYLKSIKC